MHNEDDAFYNKLETEMENIKTRDDLLNFVELLASGVRKGFFEEQAVIDYVEGIYGVLDGLEGSCEYNGYPCPDPPDWKLVGRILDAAFYHS